MFEPSFEIFNIRSNIKLGALVLIHQNGISGDIEPGFEIFNIRSKIRMSPCADRSGISGDFERSF